MTKEVKAYTPAGPGSQVTYLPVDFPHRKLYVRSYYHNGDMNRGTEHLKLSQDQDKWIPFDLNSHDFIFLMKDWFEEIQFHGKHYMADGEEREHFGGDYAHGLLTGATRTQICTVRGWATNCFYADLIDQAGATPDHDNRVQVWSMGMTRTPFDTFCYPFGDQERAEDWLEVAGMGNLRLILTHDLDSLEPGWHDIEIICQQAHPY